MAKCTDRLKSRCSPIKISSTRRLYPSGVTWVSNWVPAVDGCGSTPGQHNIRTRDFRVKLKLAAHFSLGKTQCNWGFGLGSKRLWKWLLGRMWFQILGRRKVDVVCFAVMTLQLKTAHATFCGSPMLIINHRCQRGLMDWRISSQTAGFVCRHKKTEFGFLLSHAYYWELSYISAVFSQRLDGLVKDSTVNKCFHIPS